MTAPVWNTTAGSIGIFPSAAPIVFQFSASPVLPATTLTYTLLSGSLPLGLSLSTRGQLTGTPALVSTQTTYNFAIRVTDNLNQIQDRTFSMAITAAAIPALTTPSGNILTTLDSIWVEFQIQYSNPILTNPIYISLAQGELPFGLEINETGLIRGYPAPPLTQVTYESVVTYATVTASSGNLITVISTSGFIVGREIVFTGTGFGNIIPGVTYYIQSVPNQTQFTISSTQFGPVYTLNNSTGFLTATLPNSTLGQPTIRTYTFSLELQSPLGNDIQSYYITVINQNNPSSPNLPPNTRVPTILNTQPLSYNITSDPTIYSYYILPKNSNGVTYLPSQSAYIGQIPSGEFFSFKMLGYDFDGNTLKYNYGNLPLGLTGDPNTGWITGTPVVAPDSINEFYFSVQVQKANINTYITSQIFNFSFLIANQINGDITWITPNDLGQISNGTVSTLTLLAACDVPLQYRLTSGSLPPNLTLQATGDIVGIVAFQPEEVYSSADTINTYTFTVEAFAPNYPIVQGSKTFTINVYQEFSQPTDTLYITAAPPINQRYVLEGLLQNTDIIPPEAIYRPNDPNFGIATDVTYMHAYGIYASDFDQYVSAVTKNHYWRYITLGQINTAIATDDTGNIIYEVVYSEVIDNLVNPMGVSVSKVVEWPRPINLFLGPWYTSVTDIYTSYIFPNNNGNPTYYTSLTPGTAQTLYPNSLQNMRKQVGDVLGQVYDSNILPLWMTSQQANGGTLGFTPAWVICYTKPGFSKKIAQNIQTLWVNEVNQPYALNQINFQIDRFTVDKTLTYDYNNTLNPPAWTDLPSGTPVPNPTNSQDFFVLFPQKTILPNQTQY
jgi:Putative Ig domain